MPLDIPGLRGIVEEKRSYGSVAEYPSTSRAPSSQPTRSDASPRTNLWDRRAREEIRGRDRHAGDQRPWRAGADAGSFNQRQQSAIATQSHQGRAGMPCGVPWAGARGQSGSGAGVFRRAAEFLASGVSSGGLVAEASRSADHAVHDSNYARQEVEIKPALLWVSEVRRRGKSAPISEPIVCARPLG